MRELIVDVEHVPPGTKCLYCGHENGDTTRNGTPFVQPFVVREQGTEREVWFHWGCGADHEYAAVKHHRAMADPYEEPARPHRVRAEK